MLAAVQRTGIGGALQAAPGVEHDGQRAGTIGLPVRPRPSHPASSSPGSGGRHRASPARRSRPRRARAGRRARASGARRRRLAASRAAGRGRARAGSESAASVPATAHRPRAGAGPAAPRLAQEQAQQHGGCRQHGQQARQPEQVIRRAAEAWRASVGYGGAAVGNGCMIGDCA